MTEILVGILGVIIVAGFYIVRISQQLDTLIKLQKGEPIDSLSR